MKVGVETWNSEAVAAMRDPATLAEQAGMGRGCESAGRRRGSRSNAILSATCMGPVLAPQAQPYPSTAGFVRQLFDGMDLAAFQWLQPQWFVDVRDATALHVVALVPEGLEGERVFGWTEPYMWTGLLRLWRSCILGARLRSWRIRGRI
jgi:hypothetical protein